MRQRHPLIFLLTFLVLPGACASTARGTPESVPFAPALRVELSSMDRLPSGVYYRDLRPGEGEPVRPGQQVAVHFVAWLPDGTQVDGVAPPSEPVGFRLGAGEVIQGWDRGIPGMRVGGQRMLVVPAALAYRAKRVGRVPPNSVLVFVVELARSP
jgi:FKBP-type peptidyl-prolyl cis-trans isomerase